MSESSQSGILLGILSAVLVTSFAVYSLVFYPQVLAKTASFIFDETSFVFDANIFDIDDGVAEFKELDQKDDDNSSSGFVGGTFSDTEYDTDDSVLTLDATGLTNGTGTFTSRVMDIGGEHSWDDITWIPKAPYKKELPDSKEVETAYDEDNIDMTDNLLLYHFNEDSGETFDNSAAGDLDATCDDMAGTCPSLEEDSIFQNAIRFDGVDDVIIVPADDPEEQSYDNLTELTASVWVYWEGTNNVTESFPWYDRIFELSRETNGHQSLWGMRVTLDGSIIVAFQTDDDGQVFSNFVSDGDIPMNEWQHLAFTYDGSNIKFFINGELDTTLAASGPIYTTNHAINIGIGNQADRNRPFKGYMDEFGLWTSALSDAEIESLYNRGAKRVEFQVRTCDDEECDTEDFIGPDGTTSTFYSELDNSAVGLPGTTSFTNLSDNPYFQYQVTLESDITDESPELTSVEIGPDQYYGGQATITNKTAPAYKEITGFTSTETGTGTVTYQLSNDGETWYYWDGANWSAASDLDDSNLRSVVTANIGAFHTDVGVGEINFRVIMESDTTQVPNVSNVIFDYTAQATGSSGSGSSGTTSGTTSSDSGTTDSTTSDTPSTETTQETTSETQTTQEPGTTETTNESTQTTQETTQEQLPPALPEVQEEEIVILDPEPEVSEFLISNFGITIDAGAQCSPDKTVILDVTAPTQANLLVVSNFANFSQKLDIPRTGNKFGWDLNPSSPDGVQTVYVKYMNAQGEVSPVVTDSIVVDTQTECGQALEDEEIEELEMVEKKLFEDKRLVVNNNQECTAFRNVVLSLGAFGATEVQIFNDAIGTGNWRPVPKGFINWNVSEGDGEKLVVARFRSADGTISKPVGDRINLDQTNGCEKFVVEETEEELPEEAIEEEVVDEEIVEVPEPELTNPFDGINSDIAKLDNGPESYLIDDQGAGHPFINTLVFFTHNYSFNVPVAIWNSIVNISHEAFPKTGSVLVKNVQSDRVFALEKNPNNPFIPIKRWLADELVAQNIFGLNWSDFIIDLPAALLGIAPEGEPIEDESDYTGPVRLKSRDFLSSDDVLQVIEEQERANTGYKTMMQTSSSGMQMIQYKRSNEFNEREKGQKSLVMSKSRTFDPNVENATAELLYERYLTNDTETNEHIQEEFKFKAIINFIDLKDIPLRVSTAFERSEQFSRDEQLDDVYEQRTSIEIIGCESGEYTVGEPIISGTDNETDLGFESVIDEMRKLATSQKVNGQQLSSSDGEFTDRFTQSSAEAYVIAQVDELGRLVFRSFSCSQ